MFLLAASWYLQSTFHADTKSVQIVCQGTFAVLSGIIGSTFVRRTHLSFEDPVKMKLNLTHGPCGEDVGDSGVAVKDVPTELGHLDERESDAVMDTWPKEGERR